MQVGALANVALFENWRSVLDIVALYRIEVELVLENVRVVFFLLKCDDLRLKIGAWLAPALTATHIGIRV